MWKVLIADDEPKIRRGLIGCTNWGELDMTVVGEAEDGLMAYEQARDLRPDLMLVDICMPMLNGLELIERIRTEVPDCLQIIVSGHDEFEYAQQALRLQAFDFLLKPVGPDLMRATLEKAAAELAARSCRRQYLQWAQQQFERNLPHLRETFLNDWVAGRLTWLEVKEQLDFLRLALPDSPGLLVVRPLERLGREAPAGARDRHIQLLALYSLLERELEPLAPVILFQDSKEQVVAIAGAGTGCAAAWATLPERLSREAESCLGQTIALARMPVTRIETSLAADYDALCEQISRDTGLTPTVKMARQYIDVHYAEPELSLQQVADSIPVSPSYLSRLLKQELGISFIEYVTHVRIGMATQLMHDPAMRMYEIAERVGYSSQHYFSTAFRRMLGVSPAEYRKGGTA